MSKILITGAGTTTACNFIKTVVKERGKGTINDVEIFSADSAKLCSGRWLADGFFTIPGAKDANFIDAIVRIVKENKIDAVVPIIDYEFCEFAKNKERFFDCGCKVVISSPETIEICDEKDKTCQFLKKIDVAVVDTFLSGQIKEVSLQFPVVIKPRKAGRASLDVFIVKDAKELDFYLKKCPDSIIQNYLDGEEFTVDIFNDFEGKIIGAVCRKRIATKAGVSVKGVTVKDWDLLNASMKIAESLKIIGPANIQFFRTKDGFFSTAEINPRFSGGLALSIEAGLNSPLLLVKLLKGEKPDYKPGDYKTGVYMIRFWEEIFKTEEEV